jgi:hypothetical protein
MEKTNSSKYARVYRILDVVWVVSAVGLTVLTALACWQIAAGDAAPSEKRSAILFKVLNWLVTCPTTGLGIWWCRRGDKEVENP